MKKIINGVASEYEGINSYQSDIKASNNQQMIIEQLKFNWNELKRWLHTRINTENDYIKHSNIKEKLQVEDYVIKQVLYYMQELEGRK